MMLKGYGEHATQLDYQKKGALPLKKAEMHLLLQGMLKLCNSNSADTGAAAAAQVACYSACYGSHASEASRQEHYC